QGDTGLFLASGFQPGAPVTLSVTGGSPISVTADGACQATSTISTSPSDPPGLYTITAVGPKAGGGSLSLSAQFTLRAGASASTPSPTATPTSPPTPTST